MTAESGTPAPKVCIYCKGTGDSSAGGECGFCDKGKPLDTQADWDATWGRIRVPRNDGSRTAEGGAI